MKKRALILGVTGQDGSYLADVLLERGYEVHGMYRRVSSGNFNNIQHLVDTNSIVLHEGDMLDIGSITRIMSDVSPNEIYNEADQDNVGWSYKTPGLSCEITYAAVNQILEAIRLRDPGREVKFFQPVSAMMFGDAPHPQNEDTPLNPQSPYACAKAGAYHLARYYRNCHNMFVSTAIFYNHDSPRRTEDYLLHKIAHSAVRMANGEQESLALGNLSMRVDIGYAREYMGAANGMLQLDEPDDFVISSGTDYPIDYLVRYAFQVSGVTNSMNEPMNNVHIDPKFYRPDNPSTLIGDASKAERVFGFKAKLSAPSVIHLLIDEIIKSRDGYIGILPTDKPYEAHQI